MKIKIIGFVIILIIPLWACTYSRFVRQTPEIYRAKPADYEIQIFYQDESPDRAYKIIGEIYAENPQMGLVSKWQKTGIERLKRKARECGADALMDVKIAIINPWGSPWLEGKAVVFIDD